MNIKELAQRDIAKITGNKKEWADVATLTQPSQQPFDINVIHTKHHLQLNDIGLPVNGKNASISLSESNLPISVRNQSDEVDFRDWRVDVKDSSGTLCQYIVREWFPDEMIGMIVLILGDYE